MTKKISLVLIFILTFPFEFSIAQKQNQLTVDQIQVDRWNLFTNNIFTLHQQQLKHFTFKKEISLGGYQGYNNYYEEERYIDTKTNKLLSRIQWEKNNRNNIHMIEVFVYDKQGNIMIDYLSAYLPEHRNAPIQTLINLHHHDKDLHAYRQFDASGDRIYEQCRGNFFGNNLFMSIDEDQLPYGKPDFEEKHFNEAYPSCFGDIALEAGIYINPLNATKLISASESDVIVNKPTTGSLSLLTKTIKDNPNDDVAYFKRGVLYFQEHKFNLAIKDLSQALKLKPENDEALFWRGMAYGRNKQSDNGIRDLSNYIKKHPDNSRAYTKRGVRYIWAGKLKNAQTDLQQAVKLDQSNSEAHDDLGVLFAQQKNYGQAIKHFNSALKYDPTYQKAWHNRAMVSFIQHKYEQALGDIDQSLTLKPNRDSLLLKSLILDAQGNTELAGRIRGSAEAMPDNNWSESFAIQ